MVQLVKIFLLTQLLVLEISGQASSNIEIGRLAIVDGVATASNAGIGGTSALLGINATTAITTVTADTSGKGLQSSAAVLNGKTLTKIYLKIFSYLMQLKKQYLL